MIRPYTEADRTRLEEIRAANGFDWDIPRANDPLLESIDVYCDETGTVRGLAGSRRIAEVFYIADPNWETPGQREAMLTQLYEHTESILRFKGYREVFAWLQMSKAKSFSRRLIRKWHWVLNKSATVSGQVRL